MIDLAERPGPRPAPLRIALTGLRLWIGNRDDGVGFEVHFEPDQARRLAGDLLRGAHEAELAAGPVLEQLRGIVEVNRDG